MSRYKYDSSTYRYCMYAEIEYAKDDGGNRKIVRLGDRIIIKSGAKGVVVRMYDVRTEGDIIDQVVSFRDESVADDAALKQFQNPTTGNWEPIDERYSYTMIDEIVEVFKHDRTQ